jgi:rhomboid protease GluP
MPLNDPSVSQAGRILTGSRRKAMDWSLALLSQGIECTVEQSPETGWSLLVSTEEHTRALEILDLYRRENRHWPWRQPILKRAVLFDWGSIVWVFLIGLFFWLSERAPHLKTIGCMDSRAVAAGEWWRLFTAIYLHGDIGHIAANAAIGVVLLGVVMGRFGTGAGLLAAYLAGAGGNVLDYCVYRNVTSLGASGMVMGCVGLLAVQSVSWARNPNARKYAVSVFLAAGLLFVLLGLSPESDVVAHFGGFVSGILLGVVLVAIQKFTRSSFADVAAGIVFCLLTIIPWALALSSIRKS